MSGGKEAHVADTVLDIDYEAWERSLSEIGKRALPRAAAGVLNEIAFDAQRNLKSRIETDFDNPVPFTLRAFRVNKAKPSSDVIEAEVYAQPRQAEYLRYTIFGGVRTAGDPGAGPYDVPVPAAAGRKSRAGGVPRRYAQRLSEDPNVFFAELYGLKGYWRRPRRTRAKRPRRRGVRTVANRSAPKLLLRFEDETVHPRTLQYARAIEEAASDLDPKFRRRLANEIRKARR
jgi:hypothetical protein